MLVYPWHDWIAGLVCISTRTDKVLTVAQPDRQGSERGTTQPCRYLSVLCLWCELSHCLRFKPCAWISCALSSVRMYVCARSDQQVLQLRYKKLTYSITHAVIFSSFHATSEVTTLWRYIKSVYYYYYYYYYYQCILSTFVLSCLCPESRIFCFESQTTSLQRSLVIRRL